MYQALTEALKGLRVTEENNKKKDGNLKAEEANKDTTPKTDTYVITVTQVSSSSNTNNVSPSSAPQVSYEQPQWFDDLTNERREFAVKAFKRGFLMGSQLDSAKSQRVFANGKELRELNKSLIASRKHKKKHEIGLQESFVKILKTYFYDD